MIRIGNSNFSVVIEPTGHVSRTLFRTADGKLDPGIQKRGCGIMKLGFRKCQPMTFYTKYGNVFIGLCGAFFAVVLMFALQNWRTYHQAFEDAFADPEKQAG